jgi:predicted transcriptional regulator of viral defense system
MKRLVSLVEKRAVVRARELYPFGVHPEDLSKAAHEGLLVRIGRGLYTRKDFPSNFEHQLVLACMRIPHGVVCLKSALAWHGILTPDPRHIWIAIDRKAKKPVVDGLKLRSVRFSGDALTQGVVNTRIDGVPVRIYSAAKTIADCLKYRRKIGGNLAAKVLRESIAQKKCSEQRLRHFAQIQGLEAGARCVFRGGSIGTGIAATVDTRLRINLDRQSSNPHSNLRAEPVVMEVRHLDRLYFPFRRVIKSSTKRSASEARQTRAFALSSITPSIS